MKHHSTTFLAAAFTISLLPATLRVSAADAPAAATPNIVIIYIDDMGYADIGPFFGKGENKGYTTPNLDRMAAEGTKFTSFYSAQAVCSASRAAFMTGCYSNRIGVTGALMPHAKVGLSKDETTVAEICKTSGYSTACFGKWHMGDAREFLPLQHGFDEFFGLPYSNDMTPVGQPHGVPNHGKNYAALPLISGNTVVNPSVDDAAQDQLTTWYTQHAVDFIHRHKDKPFFLYVPHSMVHVPLHVSDKFRGKTARGLFGDVVEELDWSVGEILAALKKNGIAEKTLVIFCSDNGPWLRFGNHAGSAAPLREGKGTSWDGGVREPTLMRWPGHIPADRTCDAPLMTIDLLPTVAKLTGAKLPERKIDGLDISEVITGKTDQSPHAALAFYYGANALEAVRAGKWKLEFPRRYATLDGKPGGSDGKAPEYVSRKITKAELYDLNTDPGEKHDVAAQNPAVMAQMQAHAEVFRADLGDDLTNRKGPNRREPGRTGADATYPSDAGFEKSPDPAYHPGSPPPH
jgi:arylsulfatase A